MGFVGDDDRREKSTRHREAAKTRYEDKPQRTSRRSIERVVDGVDWLLGFVIRGFLFPFKLLGRVCSSKRRR